MGAVVYHHNLKTTGEKIVPLGFLTSSIIYFVTGTLIIIASLLGIPQSFVILNVASIFAVSAIKNGHKLTFSNPITKKMYLTWIIAPVLSFIISYLLIIIKNALFN